MTSCMTSCISYFLVFPAALVSYKGRGNSPSFASRRGVSHRLRYSYGGTSTSSVSATPPTEVNGYRQLPANLRRYHSRSVVSSTHSIPARRFPARPRTPGTSGRNSPSFASRRGVSHRLRYSYGGTSTSSVSATPPTEVNGYRQLPANLRRSHRRRTSR
jgi:hypothetical protein